MIVVSDAEEACWPPTFKPLSLDCRWLALWIIQDASQSTLRSSSARTLRRSSIGGCLLSPVSKFQISSASGFREVHRRDILDRFPVQFNIEALDLRDRGYIVQYRFK